MSVIRIDWTHESFESGLELWDTYFRGMHVEIRREPGELAMVRLTITAGDVVLFELAQPNPTLAMTNALRWINGYWDLLEDGPVTYNQIPLPPEEF